MNYDKAIARFEAGECQDQAQFFHEYSYSLKGEDLQDEGEIQRRYQMLCTELKFLYVAITRPKKRLFIYDHDNEARKPIESIWTKLGAVKHITREMIVEMKQKRLTEAAAAQGVGTLGDSQCNVEMWKI